MAISDWTSLTQALPAWLDCATADISSVLSDIVDNAEKRIFRELRTPDQEVALSVNISSGTATLPSNFLELKYAYVDSNPVQYLQMAPLSYIYEKYPTRSADGKPVVMARDGASLVFGPYPDSDYVIRGSYYAALSTIGSGTNSTLLTKYPDAYLFASLLETEPILGRNDKMAIWEGKYRMVKDQINAEADRSRFGGNLSRRPG